MEYGHTFEHVRDITELEWAKLITRVFTAIENLPLYPATAGGKYSAEPLRNQIAGNNGVIPVQNPIAVLDKPDGARERIVFNGTTGPSGRSLTGEDFVFTPDRLANACVDTQRKPYDFLVCVTLILADHFAPGAKAISSMGGVSDWWPALDFVRKNIESSVVLPKGVDPERVSDPAIQKPVSAPLEIIQKGANNAPASLFF